MAPTILPTPRSKPWMSRSSLVASIVAIGLGVSCAPRPKLVYVDVDSLISTPVQPTHQASQPKSPAGSPATSAQISALEKRIVSFPVKGDPLHEARQIVAKSEQDAVREIAQRLSKTYLNEVDDIYAERKRSLSPAEQESYDKVFAQIRQRFTVYAEKRGPLLVKLAAKVGWPDPDPTSLRVPDDSNKRRLAVFKQAKELRENIKSLDYEYDKDIQALLDESKASLEQAFAGLEVEIEELRAKKLEQAEAEARKQVASVRDQIHSLVVGDPSVTLETVPSKEVAFPSASPQAYPAQKRTVQDNASQEVKADLAIWLAQNRFLLAPKGKARDATEEFKEWRNKKLSGR